jgi:hypothetical protein
VTARPEWHDWLLETGLPLTPHGGWGDLEELSLRVTRLIERAVETDDAVGYMLDETRRIRHTLVIGKLIAQGHNPYDPSVGREEWLGLIERELARWQLDTRQAIAWATIRKFAVTYQEGAYGITDLGREFLGTLTPQEE